MVTHYSLRVKIEQAGLIMEQSWNIPDIIDIEYFVVRDRQLVEEQGEGVLRERDRRLYLESICGDNPGAEPDKKWLLYRWLQERRGLEQAAQGRQALLPGRMWYELYGLFWALFSFLLFGSGAGLCYSFLAYSGEQPVNVSLFFLLFVASQFGLLLVLPISWFVYRKSGYDIRSFFLFYLVGKAMNRFLLRVGKATLDRVDSGRRQQFAAALGTAQGRGRGYRQVFFWPLFLLFQLFGLSFNFGVLSALLLKVSVSDVAFCWQSTIQMSSEFVAQAVRVIALPWSWFAGNGSYPDPAQVEGSRMVLKDGFYLLTSGDLISWWPFLALAVCFYGLLPRVVLFFFGIFYRKKSLSSFSFEGVEFRQLLHRMLTPLLHTRVSHVPENERENEKGVWDGSLIDETPVTRGAGQRLEEEKVKEPLAAAVNGQLVVLVPDELYDDCPRKILSDLCLDRFGYDIGQIYRTDSFSGRLGPDFLSRVAEGRVNSSPLLLLQEAWQPPIQENLSFFEGLRSVSSRETPVIVALIGKPTPETIFTAVNRLDRKIWLEKTAALGDVFLQVAPLVEEER